MLRLRPYKSTNANTILSWCQDERAFYKWIGKAMLQFGLKYAFENVLLYTVETYSVLGEEWKCRELMVEKR